MVERPIIFSTAMVLAILEGRKGQTRRIVKSVHQDSKYLPEYNVLGFTFIDPSEFEKDKNEVIASVISCPYGQPGDVLWVRETYYCSGSWRKDGLSKSGKQKWRFFPDPTFLPLYVGNEPTVIRKNSYRASGWYKRNSIHMPRSAARIFLKVKKVRVERLHDITEQDAMNEGSTPMLFHLNIHEEIDSSHVFYDHAPAKFRTGFEYLWNKINGDRVSWESNPCVWVIEFERIENWV